MRSNLMVATAIGVALVAGPLEGAATEEKSFFLGLDAQPQEAFNLNFVDADVRVVLDAVLGSMLRANYSIDPAVQGNISLRTARPVTPGELLPLLQTALRPIGAVVIMRGRDYVVLPREAARQAAPLQDNAAIASTGFASEIVQIRAGDAAQIAELIRQFVGAESVVAVNPALNQIAIAGDAEERAAANRIVERFDTDALANMRFELVRLQAVDPDTLATELEQVFQPPYNIIGSQVRLVPLRRLKSLLVIASNETSIGNVMSWIERLDTGGAGKRRLYSYAVQNGRARDIARTLQLVLPSSTALPLTPEPLSDSPADPATAVADADVAINDFAPAAVPGVQPGPRIVPNDETNSLLIYADGEEHEFILDALDLLDRPVPQVLIEAILAEVTLTDDLEFGLDFSVLLDNVSIFNSSGGSLVPTPVVPGLSIGYAGDRANAVLNAIESATDVRVLSAPKLIVLNNQTATLQVGDQVPVLTSQAQGIISSDAPIVNTVELKDTGVILQVTPRVNDSGAVTFDITQEVSDVAATTSSGINSPTIQQRRLSTSVTTRSGQMIALGGLIRDRKVVSKSGIPILSQIPLIGGLFGTRREDEARTELIILLTPTVLRAPRDVDAAVNQLIDALDQVGPIVRRGMESQVEIDAQPLSDE